MDFQSKLGFIIMGIGGLLFGYGEWKNYINYTTTLPIISGALCTTQTELITPTFVLIIVLGIVITLIGAVYIGWIRWGAKTND